MDHFLLFFNISGGEMLLIIIVIYLVFGPKKIPEFARMIGKGINEMRRATSDIRNEIAREANKVKNDINIDMEDPFKPEKKTYSESKNSKAADHNKSTVQTEKIKKKPKPEKNNSAQPDLK